MGIFAPAACNGRNGGDEDELFILEGNWRVNSWSSSVLLVEYSVATPTPTPHLRHLVYSSVSPTLDYRASPYTFEVYEEYGFYPSGYMFA